MYQRELHNVETAAKQYCEAVFKDYELVISDFLYQEEGVEHKDIYAMYLNKNREVYLANKIKAAMESLDSTETTKKTIYLDVFDLRKNIYLKER